jgi:uncharacterized protein involved in outer membrane biogenesis
MKKWGVVSLVIVLSLVSLSVAKNLAIKWCVEKGTRVVTGLDLKMKSLSLNLVKQSLTIHDLKLLNPKGFSDKVMMAVPNIEVDLDLAAIFKGKIHLEKLTLHLGSFNVVKNAEGVSNLSALKAISSSTLKTDVKTEKKDKKTDTGMKRGMNLQIDVFDLKIGKVTHKDYTSGNQTQSKEFNVDLHETFYDIKSPQTLIILIVTKALWATTIGRLTDVDIIALSGKISDLSQQSKKIAAQTAVDTTKYTSEALDGAGTKISDASEAAKKKLQAISEKGSDAFGEKASGLFKSLKNITTKN